MGEVGEPPPAYYYVHRAAEILGCSYIELDEHPDKLNLMAKAFTIEWGKSDGERALKKNPKFKAMMEKE